MSIPHAWSGMSPGLVKPITYSYTVDDSRLLVDWSPSWTALRNDYERTRKQVDADPDMIQDVARTQNNILR